LLVNESSFMKVLAKELLAAGALCALAACATIRPPLPPSLELPKPPSDLRAVRKGEKVTLTWSVPTVTTDRRRIRSSGATDVCRGRAATLAECGKPLSEVAPNAVAEGNSAMPGKRGGSRSGEGLSNESKSNESKSAPEKVQATFTDRLPADEGRDPQASVTYAVEVLNAGGRGAGLSNQVHVPLAPTLPAPTDFVAWLTDEGVTLTWHGDPPPALAGVRFDYRVLRRVEGSQAEVLAGEIPASEESQYKLLDSSIEWQRTYYYRAEAVTVIAPGSRTEKRIEGDDTAEVRVFADDVFPPAVPAGLQAVFSGPGQAPFIDLVWAPVESLDLAGYNVYRHEAGNAPVKVNAELVKDPAFRDTNVASGKTYFYAVSAVDARGNESAKSEETSEGVP
jgi:hypothetical protein